MSGKGIYYFMWGYQDSYRKYIQILAQNVLKSLGAPAEAEVLLVGSRSPDSNNRNPVCVEPEDGKWQLSLFKGLLDAVESNYQNHEMQSMCYGDEQSMRDKPEWIRRDSVRKSVEQALEVYDVENSVTSFCGEVRRIRDFYVTPIIQIPNTIFNQFPPLPMKPVVTGQQKSGYRSLIHAAMHAVLHEATEELQTPDPGRNTFYSMRGAEEVIRIAARDFMYTPGLAIEKQYMHSDLFASLNLISSLMYEGTKGIGQLILVDPDNDAVEFLVKFDEPIPFREPRWVRKILQMATTGVSIIASSKYIYGLGQLKESYDSNSQNSFTVIFIDHYHWELRCGEQALLRSHYAEPKLPQKPFDKMAFLANYTRLFPLSTREDGANLWDLLLIQVRQEYGSMIVVAEDAENEARRLSKQGTRIKPTRLTEQLFRSVSCIDGTILLDPAGYCHAIGIILDGEATDQCIPSRGSRYNSGVRYVQNDGPRRLVIVVSDDRTVDIIPRIRKLVSRSTIEKYIATFEAATLNNYHDSRNWLDKHRFYINAKQCDLINRTIDRINALPKDDYAIHLHTEPFEVHPEMNESYLTE
ncbi:hypothetical protein [Photobacterium leiognathi]|uniref:hypothetical protein n=1 Tax=Photobacterium leiognathi TaxID=553611 RepID=UPI0029816078|nr:hypothetical protein [Photobacterium leiognathi]